MEVIGADVKQPVKPPTRSKVVAALEASIRGDNVPVVYVARRYYWCSNDGRIMEAERPEGANSFDWTPATFSPEPPRPIEVDAGW